MFEKETHLSSADLQGKLWGARARDWAEIQEAMLAPSYHWVLDRVAASADTKLLDIGCGSGMFCQLAAERGARVSGIDAAGPLLDIARERVPHGDFQTGDMETLPYPDATFDLVAAFNSFQFAANPSAALHQARRVARPGALVFSVVFGAPQDTQALGYMQASSALLPPPPPGMPGPFALSGDGALEALVAETGLYTRERGELDCPWVYPDEATALRGLLSSGPAARAAMHAGEDAVRQAVRVAIAPFQTAAGGYRLENKYKYVLASV